MPRNLLMFRKTAAGLTAANKHMRKKYRKPVVITLSVVLLNLCFGFDWKFTIINLIWLLPFDPNNEKDPGIVHRQ